MKEFDDTFDEKIDNNNNETEDYNFFKNFRHKQINYIKGNKIEKQKTIKKGKKLKSEEKKKNFMIQDLILKRKIENEKNKERLYKLSMFENFFVSLIKKITFFREKRMIYQVYVLYIFLFIILIGVLCSIKYFIMKTSFDNYIEQNYYPFIENQVIKAQKTLKIKSDEKNNNNFISTLDEEMLFMEIFSKELIRNDIAKKGNAEIKNEEDYEKYLGESFKISSNLTDLINNDEKDINLKNLIIFYYHFVPIIYQHLESLGLSLANFYFIANSPECKNNSISNLLFKYPLEQNIYGLDIEQRNDKIYDYIVDPFIPCNNGFDILSQTDLLTEIQKNNWYYKLTDKINTSEINFRLFQLMKIDQIHKRKDYFVSFDKFNIDDSNKNLNINFLLAIRISKQNAEYPFIKYNAYNDTLFYDFLSIYNFDLNNPIIEMNNSWETMDYIFQNDYDIDDAKNLIFKNPRFLENMGFFGLKNKNTGNEENNDNMRMLKNEQNNIDGKLPLDNIILLKYYEIKDIRNFYDFNYYYEADIIYYKLIYFFNNFFQYKKLSPNYLTNGEETTQPKTNPCSISNLDEYYYSIKSNFNYDCVYDFCFFHNCQPHDELYVNRNNFNFPNCYCLPLFCKDQNTQNNSDFEKLIREKSGFDNDDDFDFSFTSNYDYFMYELETPFSQINDHFDRDKFRFMCKIDFDKKNHESNKSFIAHIYNLEYKKDDIFLMYLYNLENINNIMNDLDSNNSNFIGTIIIVYIVLCLVLGILIFIYVYFLCNKLITKMNKVKSIRKSIISNTNTNDNLNIDKVNENNINNKEQKNNINNLIENKDSPELLTKDKSDNINNISSKNSENEILIREGEEKNKNKDKKNEKSKCENSEEDDELDELMKLINSNFPLFKIEFNLNEESNDNLSNIKRQYEEIMQVNKLKNKLLLKEKTKNFNVNANKSNNSDNIEENENKKKKEKIDDLSVNVFCELLSLSNPKIDFSDIKTNFYYKENKDNSLYNLKNVLENMNEGNNAENVDIINIEKLKNALNHYDENIHNYWKNYYETQKNRDEI